MPLNKDSSSPPPNFHDFKKFDQYEADFSMSDDEVDENRPVANINLAKVDVKQRNRIDTEERVKNENLGINNHVIRQSLENLEIDRA
jgi:hypothetical protein